MIVADTSTWISFFQGEAGEDVELLARALGDRQLLMAPPVLTELMSDPGMRPDVAMTLSELPLVEIQFGFWERAGALRAKVLAKGRKARLGDALISQNVPRRWNRTLDTRSRLSRIHKSRWPNSID